MVPVKNPPATAPPTPPILELEAVRKAFPGGEVAVEGLSGRLGAGEFVSLVGPSGCGKSTALRMIAGLAAPNDGTIRWADPPAAGDIGFVFQEPTLLPWSRVWDNVYLPLRLRGEPRSVVCDRVDEALELVGLADRSRAYPRELSGGMKMRVSIARALVTRPKLLLMDEPFAALDEITRFRLNDDLLRLWQQQAWTVFFVTHSVYESVYLSQRVLVMQRPGQIVEEVVFDAPYPRDESLRRDAAYADTCATVSKALQRASDYEPRP